MLTYTWPRQIFGVVSNCLRFSSFGANVTRKYENTASVQMAYTVYEEKENDGALPPLIVMHGLFGSRNNFRSIGRAVSSTTGRMVSN